MCEPFQKDKPKYQRSKRHGTKKKVEREGVCLEKLQGTVNHTWMKETRQMLDTKIIPKEKKLLSTRPHEKWYMSKENTRLGLNGITNLAWVLDTSIKKRSSNKEYHYLPIMVKNTCKWVISREKVEHFSDFKISIKTQSTQTRLSEPCTNMLRKCIRNEDIS